MHQKERSGSLQGWWKVVSPSFGPTEGPERRGVDEQREVGPTREEVGLSTPVPSDDNVMTRTESSREIDGEIGEKTEAKEELAELTRRVRRLSGLDTT